PWNECDTQCGIGRQHRAVVCVLWRHGRYKVAKNEADCKGAGERPADTRPCTVDCQAQWFTSEWSKCSSPCDRGVQRREIKYFESANEVFSPSPNDSSFNTENKIFAKNYAYFEHGGTSFVQSTTDDGDMKLESQSFEGGKNSSKVYLNEGKLSKNISRKVLTENNKFNSSSMVNVSSRKVKKGSCIDRMKNCFLVYKARLCKLKYYNRLCCKTCFKQL
ncbi:ADAMTS-like protein 4, partial [Armadillidium vulgare]